MFSDDLICIAKAVSMGILICIDMKPSSYQTCFLISEPLLFYLFIFIVSRTYEGGCRGGAFYLGLGCRGGDPGTKHHQAHPLLDLVCLPLSCHCPSPSSFTPSPPASCSLCRHSPPPMFHPSPLSLGRGQKEMLHSLIQFLSEALLYSHTHNHTCDL